MAIDNPNFLRPGTSPGLAEGWTLESRATLKAMAGFGDPPVGREDFERWYANYAFALDELAQVARAFFDPSREGLEEFEEGWLADVYLDALPDGVFEVAVFAGLGAEAFEGGWLTQGYATAWRGVSSEQARFVGGVGVEAFDVPGFGGFDLVASARAQFWGGQQAEGFDQRAWPDMPPTP